jgi:ectoine hydroxylase-related dioxygenase (phytanoyl-CoA dioxygenase family)
MRSPDVPGRTPLETEPGDVIVFDHRLWHGSWGGRVGRRQFGMSFAAYPRRSWEETWLHGYLSRVNQRHGKRLLSEQLLATAGPRRRGLLTKVFDMGL